jgi:hypothetical protein
MPGLSSIGHHAHRTHSAPVIALSSRSRCLLTSRHSSRTGRSHLGRTAPHPCPSPRTAGRGVTAVTRAPGGG